MNGTGITEWRNHGLTSSYPLASGMKPNDFFVDASFVQFGSFIPKLNTIVISATGVTVEFTVDTGTLTVDIAAEDCVDGTVLTLRDGDRYHGNVVCGSGLATVFNNNTGATMSVNLPFSPITVRVLPLTAGLWSLQGVSEDVSITTDEAQRFTEDGSKVVWNTVAKPTHVDELILAPTMLYAATDQKKLVEIEPDSGAAKVLFSLTKAYNCIVTGLDKLLGVEDNTLFDLTTLPPSLVFTFPEDIHALAFTDTNTAKFVALGSANLYYFNLSGITDTVPLKKPGNAPRHSFVGGSGTFVLAAEEFLVTSPGPLDPNTSTSTSDLLYSVALDGSTKVKGLFTVGTDYHQAPITGITAIEGDSFVVTSDASNNKLFSYDMELSKGTLIASSPVDPFIGKFAGLTGGRGVHLTLRNVVPLKTINGVGPINSGMMVSAGGLIQVVQTGDDTLTVNLAVDIANTTIRRSKKYE